MYNQRSNGLMNHEDFDPWLNYLWSQAHFISRLLCIKVPHAVIGDAAICMKRPFSSINMDAGVIQSQYTHGRQEAKDVGNRPYTKLFYFHDVWIVKFETLGICRGVIRWDGWSAHPPGPTPSWDPCNSIIRFLKVCDLFTILIENSSCKETSCSRPKKSKHLLIYPVY